MYRTKEQKLAGICGKSLHPWIDGQKRCESCQEQYRQDNKESLGEYNKQYHQENKETIAKRGRGNKLKLTFGITIDRYNELLNNQNGVCAICQKICPSGMNLAVDHDRSCCPGNKSCGKCVRSLLCGNCNRGLGMFKESEEALHNAIEYIKRWSRSNVREG